MKGTKAAIVGAISGLLVLASGTVGFGLGRDGSISARTVAGTEGRAPQGAATAANMASADVAAPAASVPGVAARSSLPYPGPDFPGYPPFPAQAPAGDGIHAVGVAYRQSDDAGAKPGQDLVRQAFDDASKQARELAEAAGVKLGKLVALSDVKQTQPFYKACIDPLAGTGAEVKPVSPDTPKILPAPAPGTPAECSPTWYAIAWVFVRYELA